MSNVDVIKPWVEAPPADMEYHFNPRAAVPHSETYGEARAETNTAALDWPGRVADLAYGPEPRQTLDIYPPSASGGRGDVHIFIHGGYWRSRCKDDFAFVGQALAEEGFHAVVINYPLCPERDLDAVVESAKAAYAWVGEHIAAHGGDPDRITLSGHSAGAHLGAAIIAEDWPARGGTPPALKGAVLISGVYDPGPARETTLNAELRLTDGHIARHDYTTQPPRMRCPVAVIVGGGEPSGWIAFSEVYADHLRRAGTDVSYLASGEDNHFDLQDQYLDRSSDIMRAILAQR